MIYTIYEKIIEITENYKFFDYLTYFVFVLFILISSTAAIVYAVGDFSISSSKLSYTVAVDSYEGKVALPVLDVKCSSDEGLSLSMDLEISGYKPDQFLDVSITDKDSDDSKHFLIRLPSDGEKQIINYGQDLSSLASLFTFSYNSQWNLSLHGEFQKGMVIDFSNLKAYSNDGSCNLSWQVVNK